LCRNTSDGTLSGLWGWYYGVLNRTVRRVSDNERAALLGPQDGEHHRRDDQTNA